MYKFIFVFYIGHETLDWVKPLSFDFDKINEYIGDNNGSKYLTLISVDESKD